ncbi:MAG: pyrroline-5-carboxylate reductase [Ginsengibacter sp.]
MKNIAILGCGNLGASIVDGLLDANFTAPEYLTVTKRSIESIAHYQRMGIEITNDNAAAANKAEVIIIAVKPFQIIDILREIKHFCSNKIIISVVTGISLSEIVTELPEDISLFRAMPNTAIAIKQSVTCITPLKIKDFNLEFVEDLFSKLGRVVVIDEKLMDAATVLGACGIAYAMRYIRANIQGGIEIGFDARTAALIAAQTVKGAAELLLQKGLHPEAEIDKVTTPKGCTIAGLNEMEHQGFSSSLIKGILTSFKKINN